MQCLDDLIRNDAFDDRLETDLYLPDFATRLGEDPIEMERVGLGIWNVIPVQIDNVGYMLLGVPKDGMDEFGTSVFYQTENGLTGELIAAVLLRLLERNAARFMTPDGVHIKPAVLTAEPEVEGQNHLKTLEF